MHNTTSQLFACQHVYYTNIWETMTGRSQHQVFQATSKTILKTNKKTLHFPAPSYFIDICVHLTSETKIEPQQWCLTQGQTNRLCSLSSSEYFCRVQVLSQLPRKEKGTGKSCFPTSKHAHHSHTETVNIMKLEMTSLVMECSHLIWLAEKRIA